MKRDSFSPKNAYSCERKRDLVTVLGILLFVFVICFELYLVIWVPVQLKSRRVLEKEVAKKEMIDLADNLRGAIKRVNTQNKRQDGEVALAKSVVDGLAVYIRENQDSLDREQIRELYNILKSYENLSVNWTSGKYVINEESLDYSNFVKALKIKAGIDEEVN